jgi:hypothetical protein
MAYSNPEHLKRVGFKKGVSGNPLGRPKKEKLDVRSILKNILITHRDGTVTRGFDPFTKLAILAATSRSEKVQCEAASELASYIAPKLKSVEVTGEAARPLMIHFDMGSKDKNYEYSSVQVDEDVITVPS